MPSSWAISSRAKRLASSTITTRTPLPSILSSSAFEAWPCLNRIRAAHGGVVKRLADELEAIALGKAGDCLALAFFAVLVGAAIAGRARPTTIPIVGLFSDPVAWGLVAELAKPGGNVTGIDVDVGCKVGTKRL